MAAVLLPNKTGGGSGAGDGMRKYHTHGKTTRKIDTIYAHTHTRNTSRANPTSTRKNRVKQRQAVLCAAGNASPSSTVVRVGVLCGGPTAERGISLNSGRSVYDHLNGKTQCIRWQDKEKNENVRYDVSLYYVNSNKHVCKLDKRDVYSNTPSDFDFRLRTTTMSAASTSQTDGSDQHDNGLAELIKREQCDIVFPALHGKYGEDGEVQALLEQGDISFVGTASEDCRRAFDKHRCSQFMRDAGYCTLPQLLCTAASERADEGGEFAHKPRSSEEQEEEKGVWRRDIEAFFAETRVDPHMGLVVVKPCRAGSSVGVAVAKGVDEAVDAVNAIINGDAIDTRVVVELFLDRRTMTNDANAAMGAKEFTAILIDTGAGKPVALMPTEVEVRASLADSEMQQHDSDGDVSAAAGSAEVSIFDYRRKYLPTTTVCYHTPPTFGANVVNAIRELAESLFTALNLQDFARIDGWYIPAGQSQHVTDMITGKNASALGVVDNGGGIVLFSDVNITSGMEQTSFLFQQAAECRMSHTAILQQIIANAIQRQGVLEMVANSSGSTGNRGAEEATSMTQPDTAQTVFVLFGGSTSERQVSLMSGTNVWLKLREQHGMNPLPFLLKRQDDEGSIEDVGDLKVLYLPYRTVLRHTVEEVEKVCDEIARDEEANGLSPLRSSVIGTLRERGVDLSEDMYDERPTEMSMRQFVSLAKKWGARSPSSVVDIENVLASSPSTSSGDSAEDAAHTDAEAVVYIAVHGGVGEDGTIQKYFDENGVKYTGCRSDAARLCMDKRLTSETLASLGGSGVYVAPKLTVTRQAMIEAVQQRDADPATFDTLWETYKSSLSLEMPTLGGSLSGLDALCIKPALDGCSTGVAKLNDSADLATYFASVVSGTEEIAGVLLPSRSTIAMPSTAVTDFIVEPFVTTGKVVVVAKSATNEEESEGDDGSEEVVWDGTASNWVEVTTGVMAMRELGGKMYSLNPSITVKEDGDILSLDEKFQGGTGINLTPPPASIVSPHALEKAKRRFELVADTLQLSGYSRIDAFMHIETGDLIVIEVNTVPGQTPSTVLFHQTMAEDEMSGPINPGEFFTRVVENALSCM